MLTTFLTQLYTADTLSRALLTSDKTDTKLHDEAELLLAVNISDLPASKECFEEYKKAQSVDSVVINYCRHGWPEKHEVDTTMKPYWERQEYICN